MKTQTTPKTVPLKKSNSLSKKSPAQESLVKTTAAASTAAEKSVTNSRPQAEEIAARAYKIWQQQGCPEGHEDQHWCQAEKEISRDGSLTSSPLS